MGVKLLWNHRTEFANINLFYHPHSKELMANHVISYTCLHFLKTFLKSGSVCAAITSPHKLPARGYFIDEYYFLSTPCLSALNELSDSIQISPSRKTSMVCCMDYYTTAFKWAFFVESSIKPIVCVRPYDFSRCCECTVLRGILTGFISLQWHTKPAGLLCAM